MTGRRSVRKSPSSTRRDIALAVIWLVGIVAISALFSTDGMLVLDKLLPLLTFILGYFFQK